MVVCAWCVHVLYVNPPPHDSLSYLCVIRQEIDMCTRETLYICWEPCHMHMSVRISQFVFLNGDVLH